MTVSNIKLHTNPFSGSPADTQTDGWTWQS